MNRNQHRYTRSAHIFELRSWQYRGEHPRHIWRIVRSAIAIARKSRIVHIDSIFHQVDGLRQISSLSR